MINIIIKAKLLWMNKKKTLIGAAIVLLAIIITALVATAVTPRWFYIDWNDHTGVAEKCWTDGGRLLCRKPRGGMVDVKQYWRGR